MSRSAAGVTPSSVGQVQQVAVDSSAYEDVVRLAGCDFADTASACIKKDVDAGREASRSLMRRIAGAGGVFGSEPVVTFVGLAGANRVLLLGAPDQVPDARTLRRAQHFWAVFIEDADVPFDTSIDVRFSPQLPFGESREFDPAGQVSVATTSEDAKRPRIVRLGLRRFHIADAPTDVQLTFTRQGPTYGVRQWVRTYRVFRRASASLVASVLIPARRLFLEEYEIDPIQLVGGPPPTTAAIDAESQPYRLFATFVWSRPHAHDRAFEARGGARRFGAVFRAPELQFGFGFPQDWTSAVYTGVSWPLPQRPLRFSVGLSWLWDERLRAGYYVGQPLSLDTEIEQVTEKKLDRKITIGLSIDVLGRDR